MEYNEIFEHFKEVLKMNNLSHEGSVSNAKDLPVLSGARVQIEQSAVTEFSRIKKTAAIANFYGKLQETGFVLLGYQDKDGVVHLEKCQAVSQTENGYNGGANLKSWDFVNQCVEEAQSFADLGTPIIFHGHTHPADYQKNQQDELERVVASNCWSAIDIMGHMLYAELYYKKILFGAMLITASWDVNTLFYDVENQKLFRFDGVYCYHRFSKSYIQEDSYRDEDSPFVMLDPSFTDFDPIVLT